MVFARNNRMGCRRQSTHLLLCSMASPPREGESSRGREEGGGGEDATLDLAHGIARVLRRKGLRLALHFDLNKTLIMVDPAGGKTESQVPPTTYDMMPPFFFLSKTLTS